MAVTIENVKELRARSGAGMVDCKKALEACNNDVEAACDWLREKGILKAAKKADRIAAEGLTAIACEGNTAVVVEVNSETDFVSKNASFIELVNNIAKALLVSKPTTMEEALATKMGNGTVNDAIINATATIGEKISFRRFEILTKEDNDAFGEYIHMGGKIGVVVLLKGSNDVEAAKGIAMHVAASAPVYVSKDEIPSDVIEHERHIQVETAKTDPKLVGKPEQALVRIIDGKVNKHFAEMCLVDQAYVIDPSLTVGKFAESKGAKVTKFVRFNVGEGMQKREDNFAEEVMAQMGK